MDKYTLKPIARLLRLQPRAAYTHNDFTQLETSWEKPHQAPAAPVLKIYQAALAELKSKCPPGQKITRQRVIEITDQFIRARELHFKIRPKDCAHCNYYLPVAEEYGARYDLGFFHAQAPKNIETHHTVKEEFSPRELRNAIVENFLDLVRDTDGSPEEIAGKTYEVVDQTMERHAQKTPTKLHSICYVRCEEFDDALLIGNMQVDSRRQEKKWTAGELKTTLAKYPNIFRAMVQEAIKTALVNKRSRIIFQGGHANILTQWGDSNENFVRRELITEKNLAQHQKNYQTWQKQLASVTPGKIIYRPFNPRTARLERCVVIHGDATRLDYYKARFNDLIPLVYSLSCTRGFRSGITLAEQEADYIKKINIQKLAMQHGIGENFNKIYDYSQAFGGSLNFKEINQNNFGVKWWSREAPEKINQHKVHMTFYTDLVWAYMLRDAPAILTALNKIFGYVIKIDPTASPEKIKYLEKLLETGPNRPLEYEDKGLFPGSRLRAFGQGRPSPDENPARLPVYKIIESFLYEFGYHEDLKTQIPELKTLPREDGQIGIYDPEHDVYSTKISPPPALGDLAPATFASPKGVEPFYPVYSQDDLYDFYENTLRQVFRELNLEVKRTYLDSKKLPSEYATAYGWEIITPKEELQRRQIISC